MKIRITNGQGWYENHVGDEFEVVRIHKNRNGENEYIVHEDKEWLNWVDASDCEIIESTE